MPAATGAAEDGAIRFTVALLMVAIPLQRFAFSPGEHDMGLVGPIGLILAGIGLAHRHLGLRPT